MKPACIGNLIFKADVWGKSDVVYTMSRGILPYCPATLTICAFGWCWVLQYAYKWSYSEEPANYTHHKNVVSAFRGNRMIGTIAGARTQPYTIVV